MQSILSAVTSQNSLFEIVKRQQICSQWKVAIAQATNLIKYPFAVLEE